MIKIYKDNAGEWRWKFVAKNGEVLSNGTEGYRASGDLEHALNILFGNRFEREYEEEEGAD